MAGSCLIAFFSLLDHRLYVSVIGLLQNAAVCHDCNPTTHVAYHSLKEDIHEFKFLRRDGVGSGGRGTKRQT